MDAEAESLIDAKTLLTKIPISKQYLSQLCRRSSDPLPNIPLGSRRLFRWSSVVAWLEAHEVGRPELAAAGA